MSLAVEVLRRLDDAGVLYCHWKSNDHLAAALDGVDDLDILISATSIDVAYRVFAEMGCRRGRVAPARNEVGLEDFLGLDDETGGVVHFHVHYRLATGERHLKRYRLPWEHAVLASRVRDADTGVWITAPELEIVLLLCRQALRLRWRDRLHAAGTNDELIFLLGNADTDGVQAAANLVLDEHGATEVSRFIGKGTRSGSRPRLRRALRRQLRASTANRGLHAFLSRGLRELTWLRRGISRKVHAHPVLLGRGGPAGGLMVAVIGCDGSGKSTLVNSLRESLSAKLDVYPVYLGSGNGSSSALRAPMKWGRNRFLGKPRTAGAAERTRATSEEHAQTIALAKAAWAMALADEKKRKLKRAMLARTRGMVVICDRWPQDQYPGELDGPRLQHWRNGGWIKRRLASWEARPYRQARLAPPDLILMLDIDIDTAALRRPNDDRNYLEHRIEVLRALRLKNEIGTVVELDGTRPADKVLAQAMRAIWDRL